MFDRTIVFNESIIGNKHIKSNTSCEDASGVLKKSNYQVCVVADGHGSNNAMRSAKGSKFAVDVTIECIENFMKNIDRESLLYDSGKAKLRTLSEKIIKEWKNKIQNDLEDDNFSDEELNEADEYYRDKYALGNDYEKAYGTTLIAFVMAKDFAFGLQIGDGTCVAFDENAEAFKPIEDDPRCFNNETTSLCDDDALDEFRYVVLEKKPIAVFCGTDGIENSFPGEYDELKIFYRKTLANCCEYGNDGIKGLYAYLPVISEKGSQDDVSVSGIINLNYRNEIMEIIKNETNEQNEDEELYEEEKGGLISGLFKFIGEFFQSEA